MRVVRVIIGDRSPSVRAVLRRLLSHSPALEVVGEAADGEQLADAVRQRRPDVIVSEFLPPDVDASATGPRVGEVAGRWPIPVVVLTSEPTVEGTRVSRSGSARGVVEVLQKPQVPAAWHDLAPMLHSLLLQIGAPTTRIAGDGVSVPDPPTARKLDYVAIGGSTGGPGAVVRLLGELGRGFDAGVAVVQHIADGFEHSFADWLRQMLGADVRVAEPGESLCPGAIRVAPVGSHLVIDGGGTLHLDVDTPPRRGHRPSADLLFRSFLSVGAERVGAVLLSGMGDDGVEGMLVLREAGSLTLAQDEASSAVYGMPRLALDTGAAAMALPPTDIGKMLARLIGGGTLR